MFSFLLAGAVLGISAGFAPGPLLALVISETLAHDVRAGVKVAIAPILTDLPIITVTLFILARLAPFHHILGIISLAGACFILILGLKNIMTTEVQVNLPRPTSRSLQKGIMVNALSPHPYLFWFSVGGPTTIQATEASVPAAIIFVASFYVLLVGSKITLAVVTERSRSFLQGPRYIFTIRLLGGLLIILAGFLCRDGLRLLGIF